MHRLYGLIKRLGGMFGYFTADINNLEKLIPAFLVLAVFGLLFRFIRIPVR